MAFSFNQHYLNKLEAFLKDLGWQVRYEKGNFQSGSCIVRDKQMVVINKFIPLEQKINSLIDIVLDLEPKIDVMKVQNSGFLNELKKIKMVS